MDNTAMDNTAMDNAQGYSARLAELRSVDAELARVDNARAWLRRRRIELLTELERLSPPVPQVATAWPDLPARRTELSVRTVARVLLSAGAALVVIATAAFTAANWGSLGVADR